LIIFSKALDKMHHLVQKYEKSETKNKKKFILIQFIMARYDT